MLQLKKVYLEDLCATFQTRCFAQLAILGHILHPIFTHPTWVPILLVIMLLVAAVEVMSRPSYSYSVSA